MKHIDKTHGAVDSTSMRQSNAALVLRLIWNEGPLSRADLARRTGMSASTISDITNELRELGLICDRGTGASSGGRRPLLLGIQEQRVNIIGVELGASHITVTAISFCGDVLCMKRVENDTREDPQGTLDKLFSLVDWCFEQPGVDRQAWLGLGLAVPAPVNPSAPGELSRLILPKWSEIDLLELLSERYQKPVFLENDANAGAIAEQWFGDHEDTQNLIFVKVATGIGAGFIIDGRLYRGSGGMAGEIGHLSIDPNGAPCVCGGRGCLVTMIGTHALIQSAREHVRPRHSDDVTSIHDIIAATLDGDRAALEIVEVAGSHLGTALAGLLNLMNPAVVVLGGELTQLRSVLLDPLRISLRRQAMFGSVARARIVTSTLGESSIAVGAGTLVLDAALDDLTLFRSVLAQGAA